MYCFVFIGIDRLTKINVKAMRDPRFVIFWVTTGMTMLVLTKILFPRACSSFVRTNVQDIAQRCEHTVGVCATVGPAEPARARHLISRLN